MLPGRGMTAVHVNLFELEVLLLPVDLFGHS